MIKPWGQNLVPVCSYTGWFVCLQFFSIFSLFQYRFTNLLPYFKIKPFSARDIHTLKQTTRCDYVKSSVPSQVCVCALFCFSFLLQWMLFHTPAERDVHMATLSGAVGCTHMFFTRSLTDTTQTYTHGSSFSSGGG